MPGEWRVSLGLPWNLDIPVSWLLKHYRRGVLCVENASISETSFIVL